MSGIEKVSVPKEVAEALEECERNYIPTDLALSFHASGDLTGKYAPLQTMSISELASALIIGYEIEKTPEEKLLEYYKDIKKRRTDSITMGFDYLADRNYGRLNGILQTLDILGITIEGINDN